MIKLDQRKKIENAHFDDPGGKPLALHNDVHIWKFPAIQISSSLLTAAEYSFAGRFRFDDDRNRFTVGRHALRLLISKYLSMDPVEISISAEMGQKPIVSNLPANIHFNISHSGNWVLIAFAKDELGIDIERIDRDFVYRDILEDHFSEAEQAFGFSSADPAAAFYYLWTRKEALTKAWGTGLQENLKEVIVLNEAAVFEKNAKSWKLMSFSITESYPAALAFPIALENVLYLDGAGMLSVI